VNSYRICFLAPDGHVGGAKLIFHSTDEEAVAVAEQLVDDRVVELWDHTRRVKRFDPKDAG
jgi:hypothetical protein